MRSLLLHEWIDGALGSVDTSTDPLADFGVDPRNLALSSDAYLAAALTVARSLADQICQLRTAEVSRGNAPDNGRRCCRSLLENDRAENVMVHLRGDDDGLGGSLNSTTESVQVPWADDEQKLRDGSSVQYLSVTCAAFSPCSSPGHNDSNCKEMNETECIYSLGHVFYELFSGGEKPSQSGGDGTVNDFARALSIRDDLGGGGDPLEELALGTHRSRDSTVSTSACALSTVDDIVGSDDQLKETALGIHDVDDVDPEAPGAKRRTVRIVHRASSVSVDDLASKGLPMPLCDLISNMIHCAHGGDESYCKLSDVLDDLQRMIDVPDTFLHDIDVEKLSADGLQLDERIFGRDDDLAALKDSYRRAAFDGQSEWGLITGLSGAGKSFLAQRLGDDVTKSGGLFLRGKFDQTQAAPFSAISAAFAQYCSTMIDEGETIRVKRVRSELKNALGNEAHTLARVIPGLARLLGLEETAVERGEVQGSGCVDPQMRLWYLMCKFVGVISSYSEVPVTLFMDDVQWADARSIEFFFRLPTRLGFQRRQFYFLASMRRGESASDGQEDDASELFHEMISQAHLFDVSVTTVKLALMDEGAINSMMSGLLRLSPRLTRPLSNIIHHQTKGNPFFVSQLVVSLYKEGLLRLNLGRRRWEWDEDKISARRLPTDVVEFLVHTIRGQPANVQSSLRVLSCFGAQTRHRLVQALEQKLDLPLIQSLEIAVAEGLLKNVDEFYTFSHDKIQEAAYQMTKPEDRCLYHFKIGVGLVPFALEMGDDDALCIAASQINTAGPAAIQDEEQGLLIANLNLTAGQKSMEKSDYQSAHSYFDHGISFLCKNHWRDHYNLSLQLFEFAAECALAIGDLESLALLIAQIDKFGKSLEDKLNSRYLLVCTLAASSKVGESITEGAVILSKLGIDISVDASEDKLQSHLQGVQTMLWNVSDEQLLNYKAVEDRTKIMVTKLLARLCHSMYLMLRPSMHITTLKMVEFSLRHGMSSVSPMAFACYGSQLATLGNIREGYRYVKVAFKMLDQTESKAVAGQTIGVGAHILCYVEPVHATIDFFMKGYDVAMKAGDIYFAILHRFSYTLGLFWSSRANIEIVKEELAQCRLLMKQYKQFTWLTNLSIAETSTLTLVGSEDEIDRSADFSGNQLFELFYRFQNLYVGYMFHRHDQMFTSAVGYYRSNRNGFFSYFDSCQSFIAGLASFRIYRASSDPVWANRGCQAKLQMKRWAETSEWNFKGKLHLLEAEENSSNGDFENAITSYEDAISNSKAHKFLNDEALACELAGHHFLAQGKKNKALNYFLRAHEKYGEWGACAKANNLFEFVQENIATSI